MRKLAALALLLGFGMIHSPAQDVAAKGEVKKAEKVENASAQKTAGGQILGPDQSLKAREPVTTEIYAEEAFFDSSKYIGTFKGHVKVIDPRFNLQSDKLTIYVSRGQNQGLEKAVAEGNVAVVRDRPDPNGGAPSRSVGRSETATYIGATGDMELKGNPRVTQGVNIHIATRQDTVMIVNQNGQLTTHGPSRTDIHQEPKSAEGEKKAERPPGQ
jgi:lipopolysaccharide transport protein LptA